MRGWSYGSMPTSETDGICPAYAGMILLSILAYCWGAYLSRVCGDDPKSNLPLWSSNLFVPRMRGWSENIVHIIFCREICPAYAGMIPYFFIKKIFRKNLSRVCGDDPRLLFPRLKHFSFVPRMRGWSLELWQQSNSSKICPAYAGMILFWLFAPV